MILGKSLNFFPLINDTPRGPGVHHLTLRCDGPKKNNNLVSLHHVLNQISQKVYLFINNIVRQFRSLQGYPNLSGLKIWRSWEMNFLNLRQSEVLFSVMGAGRLPLFHYLVRGSYSRSLLHMQVGCSRVKPKQTKIS